MKDMLGLGVSVSELWAVKKQVPERKKKEAAYEHLSTRGLSSNQNNMCEFTSAPQL